jgi:hypothetical protein
MSRAQTFGSTQSAQSAPAAGLLDALDASLPRLEVVALPVPAALRLARVTAGFALAMTFLAHLGLMTFVDPDLWHEMATARQLWERGAMPLADEFAYTPTVYPVVHHEWGTGAVLYAVSLAGGAPALMFVKYLLTFGTAAFCFATARRRGASWEAILSLAPLTILAGIIGFTTIRAQLFTLFFTAWLLYDLSGDERDATWTEADGRHSPRRRMWKWLPLYVAWLNLHAGFVVGAGLAALYAVESLVRGRPMRHLIAAGVAAAALVAVNPYGFDYYPYLLHGLTMPRPLVTEWQPLHTAEPTMFRMFVVSLIVAAYAVAKLGVRRTPDLLILAVTAYLAARHTRHVSIYFVVWLCLVPGYVQQTALGTTLVEAWCRRRRWIAAAAALVAGVSLVRAVECEPWRLVVPTTVADEQMGRPVYPVGAVDYLRNMQFAGNLFTPFVPGGYCLFQLHPAVRVSLDGRYEVAYRHGILEENVDFYAAQPDWRTTLEKYPTDLVLVPRSAPVAAKLRDETPWRETYVDDVYALFARPGLKLPHVDRSGGAPQPAFP